MNQRIKSCHVDLKDDDCVEILVNKIKRKDWQLVWYSCIILNRPETLILYSPPSTAQKPVIPKFSGLMVMNTSVPPAT